MRHVELHSGVVVKVLVPELARDGFGCFGNPKTMRPPQIAFMAAPGLFGVSPQTTRMRKVGPAANPSASLSASSFTCSVPLGVTTVLYHVSKYSPPQSVSRKLLKKMVRMALPPTSTG